MQRCENGAVLLTTMLLLLSFTFATAWLVQKQLQQSKQTQQLRHQVLSQEIAMQTIFSDALMHWQKTGQPFTASPAGYSSSLIEQGEILSMRIQQPTGKFIQQQLDILPLFSSLPQQAQWSLMEQQQTWKELLHVTHPAQLTTMTTEVWQHCDFTSQWQGLVVVQGDCKVPANTQFGDAHSPLVLVVLGETLEVAAHSYLTAVVLVAADKPQVKIAPTARIEGVVISLPPLQLLTQQLQFRDDIIALVQTSEEIKVRKQREGTWRNF